MIPFPLQRKTKTDIIFSDENLIIYIFFFFSIEKVMANLIKKRYCQIIIKENEKKKLLNVRVGENRIKIEEKCTRFCILEERKK